MALLNTATGQKQIVPLTVKQPTTPTPKIVQPVATNPKTGATHVTQTANGQLALGGIGATPTGSAPTTVPKTQAASYTPPKSAVTPKTTTTTQPQTTVPSFQQGNPTYDPSSLQALSNTVLQQILNGTGSQESTWEQEAQQEAQASYQQQWAAYQQYLNNLKAQQDATNAGYYQQLQGAQNTLNDTSFQDYLQSRDDMAQRGLATSGLNTAQNTQLALAQQQQEGQLQNQYAQQVAANNAADNSQADSIYSEMAQLDPQALYDQYLSSLQQAGQSANQQTVSELQALASLMAPYESPTADQYGTLSNNAQQNADTAAYQQGELYNTASKNAADAAYQQGELGNTAQQIANTAAYQQGELANTAYNYQTTRQNDQANQQINQQKANTAAFTAQADANYKAIMAQNAQQTLQLKSTDDAATIQQKNQQLQLDSQTIANDAARYAQQNANTANDAKISAYTKVISSLQSEMNTALNDGDTARYNQLYSQWQTQVSNLYTAMGVPTSGK